MVPGTRNNEMKYNLGKGAPRTTNKQGGMQADTGLRFDLLDPRAMFELAARMAYGAKKYAPDNWRKISWREHAGHCIAHLYAAMAGMEDDDHIAGAFARAMMVTATYLTSKAS